jgi:hypothetical protein
MNKSAEVSPRTHNVAKFAESVVVFVAVVVAPIEGAGLVPATTD